MACTFYGNDALNLGSAALTLSYVEITLKSQDRMSANSRDKLVPAECIREELGFISAATPNILSKDFLGFIQYIETNSREVDKIMTSMYPFHVVSNLFYTILYLSTLLH